MIRGLLGTAALIGLKHLSIPEQAGAAALRCPSGLSLGVCVDSANAAYKLHVDACVRLADTIRAGKDPGRAFVEGMRCAQSATNVRNSRIAACRRDCPKNPPKPKKPHPVAPNPNPLPPPPPPPVPSPPPAGCCPQGGYCLPCPKPDDPSRILCCFFPAKPDDPNPCCPKS
jgi:hypothetical protein